MNRIAHIINPYASKSEDAQQIQKLTCQSMEEAQAFSKNAEVSLWAAVHENEPIEIPYVFRKTSPINRYITDLHDFQNPIPFTLIQDIISKTEEIDADYIVYTNMDIIVQPFFYDFISNEIEKGRDALIINRRRIHKGNLFSSSLSEILAEPGKYHPGFDCFVLKKELLARFILKDICVGIPFIGVSMAHNIFSFANNYRLISKHHLTSHIGLQVMGGIPQEYYRHNYAAFQKIRAGLKPYLKKANLPYSELPLLKRIIAWGLNPSTPILLNLEIEGKSFSEKIYFFWNELRFKILDKISSSG